MIVEGGIERSSLKTRRAGRSSLTTGAGKTLTGFVHLRWDHYFDNGPSDKYNSDRENNAPAGDDTEVSFSFDENEECWEQSQKKRVCFTSDVVSSLVVMEERQTPREVIWYSPEEFRDSTQKLQEMIQQARRERTTPLSPSQVVCGEQLNSNSNSNANSNSNSNSNANSLRGLEDVVSLQALQDRRQRQNAVLQGVLQEQARQHSQKRLDPETIGRQSALASQSSREKALMRGNMDALAAYPTTRTSVVVGDVSTSKRQR